MSKLINVKVKGNRQVGRAMRRLGKRAVPAMKKALVEQAEPIMTESKEKEVPVDTGNLKSTGHVRPPVQHGTVVSVTMGYGGPAAPYALEVHENKEMRHRGSQKAGYLGDPLNRALPGMLPGIAATLRRELMRPV